MKKFKVHTLLFTAIFLQLFVGCKEDEVIKKAEPKARFSFTLDANDFRKVTFKNESVDAESFSWNFGDGQTSTAENPVHTFAGAGQFEVSLTASNPDGTTDMRRETLTIVDPLAAQRALIGETGKTWKLIRDVSKGTYPFVVGPTDRSQIWWSYGGAQPICERPCILDDTYTFNPGGTMVRNVGADFWGEGGLWPDAKVGCFDATVPSNWTSNTGQNLSAWGNGTFQYVYDVNAKTLKLSGLGAYMGLSKAGTTAEFTTPQQEVVYKVVKVVDAAVDTLVLETTLTAAGGYWAFTFVSYDNPASEPPIPTCAVVEKVNVTFQLNFNDYNGTAVNPEVNGTWNNWCGNCNKMTDANGDGIWEVTLELPVGNHEYKFSADNWGDQESLTQGSACTATNVDGFTNRKLTVGTTNMTLETVCWASCDNCPFNLKKDDLQGKTWKLANGAGAVRVGPGIGSGEWFTSDQAWADSKPCLFDDAFTFTATNMTINVGAQVFTEAFMAGINADGCVAVANLPANLATWGGGTFPYTFKEATAQAKAELEVTGKGAYIGFYKGGNGLEFAQPQDGSVKYKILSFVDGPTSDTMEITIDISAGQDGSAYWTYKLVSQ